MPQHGRSVCSLSDKDTQQILPEYSTQGPSGRWTPPRLPLVSRRPVCDIHGQDLKAQAETEERLDWEPQDVHTKQRFSWKQNVFPVRFK